MELYEIAMRIVFWSSVISLILPPVEFFDDYPKIKKNYILVVRIVNYYGALNLRGKVVQQYPSVKKKNGQAGQPGLPGPPPPAI